MAGKKYLADYGLDNILDRKGKLKTVAIYRGPYFRFTAGEAAVKRARTKCLVYTALCLALLAVPLLVNTACIRRWYVVLPLIGCLLAEVHLVMGDYRLLTAKDKVTREHKDKIHDRFALWSILLGVFALLSLIGQIVFYRVSDAGGTDVAVTLCTVGLMALAVLLFRSLEPLLMEEAPKEP